MKTRILGSQTRTSRVRSSLRVDDHDVEAIGVQAQDAALDEKPHSIYEIVTRQMLADLREDVAEVKGRVNALLWLMAGAILVEFVMRFVR